MTNLKLRIILIFRIFIFAAFLIIGVSGVAEKSWATYQPLEIINIKPASTGNPAIPNTHRIFYAYPGIEYKIRAAVVGGDYPYTYQLSNAPAGMTVDSAGYIHWSNPQASANNIGLRITDSLGVYIDTSWSISVQTDGFKFVDSNAQTNGDGTISNPYNSILNMVAGANSTDIIYFRNGTYQVPVRGDFVLDNAVSFDFTDSSDTAVKWLAYPDEDVIIDLENNKFFYSATDIPFYFQGLHFYRGREYFFRAVSTSNYVNFLDNTFETLISERPTYNGNSGSYYTEHGGTGHYLVFQGNTFSGFYGSQGVGSFYDQHTLLIENNIFLDFNDSGISANQVLGTKVGLVGVTIRGNMATVSGESGYGVFGGSLNGFFGDGTVNQHGDKSENIEILYNYFRIAGTHGNYLNWRSDMGATWIYRNTFVSNFIMAGLDGSNCDGPFIINGNVLQNTENGGIDYHYTCVGEYTNCVSQSGNISGSSGIVDDSGLLNESYSGYIGEVGWQLADGSTPVELNNNVDTVAPTAPVNLSVQ